MIRQPVAPPVTEYLFSKSARNGTPLSGTFELTPLCNMNCKMCYVRMTKAQQEAIAPLQPGEKWLELGRIARDHGMLYLLLTGGEPLLHPDFPEILEGLHKMGLVISVNSNATLIDEKAMEYIRKAAPSRFNITLYGASNDTYAKLCGNPQGFTQVTRAIHLLKDAGINIKINCSLTPYNAADLEGIYDFCRAEQLQIQATSYMFPPLRRDPSMVGQNDRFSPKEAAYYAAKINLLATGRDAFLARMEDPTQRPVLDIPDEDCQDVAGEGLRCRAGKCCFWVTWDGRFLPCGMISSLDPPNIFKTGFQEAWNQVHAQTAAITLPSACAACNIKDQCKACAAMVYTESGCFDTVPQYRCQMSKEYPEQCMRLYRELRGEKL